MESNGGISDGMLPGMLRSEMPSHQQPSQTQHRHLHNQMPPCAQQQQQARHPYGMPITSKLPTPTVPATTTRQNLSSNSDEEEAGSGCRVEDVSGDHGRGGSLWQRMKWTDDMVRLLIMVVFLVGDDSSGGMDTAASGESAKKKHHPSGSGTAGAIQKKGKWKSVSRAMLEKGFRVSPQQCEDKFNDLNKRYKRVIDIVGKGTSCRVVENPSLLETMDHISPKLKDEVKKLLNSKHLFFKEMCAYHSSITHQLCDVSDGPPENPLPAPQFSRPSINSGSVQEYLSLPTKTDENHHIEDEGDDNDDGDEDNDHGDINVEDREENRGGDDREPFLKRLRRAIGENGTAPSSLPPFQRQLRAEMAGVLRDGGKTALEQREWIRNRSMALEEQKVSYHCRSLELEKQRFKRLVYSTKKEREFEGLKLENERLRLENERMILMLRQKEMEIDGITVINRAGPQRSLDELDNMT